MPASSTITVWRELVEVARWAPSPHNTQPWAVREIDADRAKLFMVSSRRLPDEDTTGCFLICAMGIFIEALRIVAANRGIALRAVLRGSLDLERELIPFADLTLEGGADADEYSNASILGRRTSRVRCVKAPPGEAVARAAEIARRYGHDAGIVTDTGVIKALMDTNAETVMHDLSDARYGGEIRRWYRYTRGQAEHTRDGLEARCMNIPAHEMWLSARCPWLMRTPGVRSVMERVYHRRVGHVPALLVVSGEFFEHGAAERAGAMLLRLWLAMHELGVTIHPFGNLVTNPKAHRRLTETLGAAGVWLVARAGVTGVPPRSLRLETGAIVRAC
ncbi:MAG: hypothetical protein ACTS3F_03225 [Phycisphaerales bacterium]